MHMYMFKYNNVTIYIYIYCVEITLLGNIQVYIVFVSNDELPSIFLHGDCIVLYK